MRYLLLIVLLSFTINIIAQPTFSKLYRADSSETTQTSFHDIIIRDNAYYLSGNQKVLGNWIEEGLLMKVDTNGQKIWSRNYGDTTNNQFNYGELLYTEHGYLATVTFSYDGTSSLIFIDSNGYVIHKKDFTSDTGANQLFLSSIVKDKSNNLYLYGNMYPDVYTSKPVLIKTDSLGNEYWRKYYPPFSYEDGFTVNIIPYRDNEFILVNKVTLNEYQQLSYKMGAWLIKVDSSGNILDEYNTPFNNRWISVINTIKTKDNCIIFYGTEGRRDNNLNWDYEYFGYIAKLDSNFQLLWEKRYGQVRSFFVDVKEKDNGDLLLTGQVVTNYLPDSVQYSGWLMALDANGDSLWQRKYHSLYDAAYPYHVAEDLEILDDGRLVMSGYINNIRPTSPNFGYWGWLIRTDSLGCIVPGCQLLDNTENVAVVFDNDVVVFPNPIAIGSASDVVNFKFDKVINEKAVIRVYSGLGQLVGETELNHSDIAKINVSDFNSGMYFYGVYVEGVLVKQGQVLVQR